MKEHVTVTELVSTPQMACWSDEFIGFGLFMGFSKEEKNI